MTQILHLWRERAVPAQNTEYEIHRVLTVETLKIDVQTSVF